jgi:hypothetical protein
MECSFIGLREDGVERLAMSISLLPFIKQPLAWLPYEIKCLLAKAKFGGVLPG